MPAAKPRPESADSMAPAASSPGVAVSSHAPAGPVPPARLADELAVPAPSPVHQLQAGLAQFAAPPGPAAEPLYPGWLRIAFPLASSALLWAALLWGASRLA